MSAPLDIAGILERAGADANAPEGSQAWALGQAGEAIAELIEAAKEGMDRFEFIHGGYCSRLRAALANVGGA
jgi:hypothetical protein